MDLSLVCRTCLRSDTLKPIFTSEEDHETYSNDIYVITGVQIIYNDQLPQNMCVFCIDKLSDILRFRKQCKSAEGYLINTLTEKKYIHIAKQEITQNKITKPQLKQFEFNDHNEDNTYFGDCDKNESKPSLHSISTSINVIGFKDDDYETQSKEDLGDYDQTQEPYCIVINSMTEPQTEVIELKTHDNILGLTGSEIKPKKRKLKKNSNYKQCNSFSDIKEHPTFNPLVASEIPYELIKDPVTGKCSRVFCKLCNKELSVRSIDAHMIKRHPGADKRKVKCDLCDNYVMRQKLNRHKILMHGNGCIMCSYCKSKFNSKEDLASHVKTCAAKKRKRKVNDSGRELIECDVCHKVMQKASLRMHKAVKHAGLKPACEHCGRTFGNKFRLKEHLRAKHGYEKFQCSYCDFKSAGVMAMRNHERRHRGEKPFICEHCGAKFHAAYLLAQHRHSHRTEKLVKCDLCPASFKANNSLHMHKLTCHSRSMYKCTVCCRAYKCRHYAVKHVRHVHRYNGPTPPLTIITNEELVKQNNS